MEAARPRLIIVWLVVAAVVQTAWQILRLQQRDPAAWLACDYAMRLCTLGILAIDPTVRATVFRRERLKISLAVVICWGLWLIPLIFLATIVADVYAALLPSFRVGVFPRPEGWLKLFDLTLGIALVGIHEELFFRRALRAGLAGLGDGKGMVLVSALLFGGFHWWTGVPNMIVATAFGIGFMRIYRDGGALWPVVVMHSLADLWYFS